MISQKIEQALNNQIKLEEESSRIYLAMASWCEANGYPGAARFLFVHSDEERMHELKFVNYINDRSGYAKLQALDMPKHDFDSFEDLFEQILKHERYVSSQINELFGLTLEEKDYTTGQFLQWFIMEQIEEESLFRGILDKIELAGGEKGGIFHIDKELGAMAAATAAPAPKTA
jgi:ferritin